MNVPRGGLYVPLTIRTHRNRPDRVRLAKIRGGSAGTAVAWLALPASGELRRPPPNHPLCLRAPHPPQSEERAFSRYSPAAHGDRPARPGTLPVGGLPAHAEHSLGYGEPFRRRNPGRLAQRGLGWATSCATVRAHRSVQGDHSPLAESGPTLAVRYLLSHARFGLQLRLRAQSRA